MTIYDCRTKMREIRIEGILALEAKAELSIHIPI